jgi:predicted RNase H-like nuclease (RuvC/YqgF family)
MKLKKPDKSVSDMDVLKDIRGLLSVTREREDVTADRVGDANSLKIDAVKFEAQITHYKELVQKLQEELRRVENEKEEFAAKLKVLDSGNNKLMSAASKSTALSEETAQFEARIAELSSVLSQVDGVLKLRVQELSKRIARLFQEAGQGDMAIEFRKAASELEIVENFARFLQILLGQ